MPLINKNPLLNTTFHCEQCGAEKTERTCWYKKRAHHFCSRVCANRYKAAKVSLGMTKKEYEKAYWSKPENKERKRTSQRTAYLNRMNKFDDSLKKVMLTRARARAKKSNIPFNITIEDFEIPDSCPVLNIPFSISTKQGGDYNSPSLDRIIPNLGYVKGNVIVISKRANLIKTDAQIHELESVLRFMKYLFQHEAEQSSFRP